jgi:hypothetical protein
VLEVALGKLLQGEKVLLVQASGVRWLAQYSVFLPKVYELDAVPQQPWQQRLLWLTYLIGGCHKRGKEIPRNCIRTGD